VFSSFSRAPPAGLRTRPLCVDGERAERAHGAPAG